MTDFRQQIVAALRDFDTYPLPEAATRLFATLGYKSDRVLPIATVADFCREVGSGPYSHATRAGNPGPTDLAPFPVPTH